MQDYGKVRLDELEVDLSLQPRVGGTAPAHVQALMENHEGWSPLKVIRQGDQYLLVDGFQRLEAAKSLKLEAVPIETLQVPEDGDLEALAFSLNVLHGKPLSLDDQRNFAERLLREKPNLADREIGRRCGLSGNTVGSLRTKLEESAQIEQSIERVGRGGYRHTVERREGELPEPESGDAIAELLTSRERKQQRRIARYLERLSVALDDQFDLQGWETNAEAAEACREVLEEECVEELVQELGSGAYNVLQVAFALGYEDEPEEHS